MRIELKGFVLVDATLTANGSRSFCMQTPLGAGQSNDLICGVCRKYLHVPYTLPCKHSYCLEPCLISRPSQTDVRCFRCDKVYPRDLAMHNATLERRVTQHFVEERRSLVTTCNACRHPAPVLRACQHCQLSVCSSCWDSHYAEVVTSVTNSTRTLLKTKKDLEEIRNSLKAKPCGQRSYLKNCIKQATLELKDACDKSLDLNTTNLNTIFAGRQDELVALKEATIRTGERIARYAYREQLFPQMALDGLLDLREKLNYVSTLMKDIHEKVDRCQAKERLRVGHSLTNALETLSLIDVTDQEVDDDHSSCPDEVSEIGSVIDDASTGKQVFVGGVSGKVNFMQLGEYFSRYGSVKNSFVSHRKGFGCITFASEESVRKAISQRFQSICGTRVEVKEYITKKNNRAALKTEPSTKGSPSLHLLEQEKVFIGGISADITEASLKSSLSQLGPVQKLDMVPQRGFGVVVFSEPQTAELAILRHWHNVDGKRVELLPFVPDKKARDALKRSASKPQVQMDAADKSSSKSPSSPPLAPPSPHTPAPPLEERRRIFVGGLAWDTTADSLKSALSKLGPVQRVDISPKRGFAIVLFEWPETSQVAITVHWFIVDGKMVELRPFVPNQKFEKSAEEQKTLGSAGDWPLEDLSHRTLHVEGIGKSISESILGMYFSKYGDVKQCRIANQRGCVVFGRSQDLKNALKAQSHNLNGQRLVLIPPLSEMPKTSDFGATRTSAVSSMVNARKLIIQGLGEGTTHTVLRDYFLNYGAVDYASVTGTEAWVVFKNAKTVNLVLATQPHFIRGRQITLRKPDGGDAPLLGASTLSLGGKDEAPAQTAPQLGPLFNPHVRISSPRRVESSSSLSSRKGRAGGSGKQPPPPPSRKRL
uniref:RNA recognition motif RNP 1 n=1 Tax=Echinococcus granulosus TaxID=6210 RepID=A0A068WT03_ECHGR|nr:RNA recognition motif RNP 1 [Echinococcus granulosus]